MGWCLFFNDAGGELRSMGWAHRDVQIAALIHLGIRPPGLTRSTAPARLGSNPANDLADANANYPIDQFNAGFTV